MASKSHLPCFLLLTQPGSGANRTASDPIIALACADYALNCHSIGRCQINLSDIHVLVSHLGGYRDNIDTFARVALPSLQVPPVLSSWAATWMSACFFNVSSLAVSDCTSDGVAG